MTGVCITGVTASGKSALAAEFALRHGGEILSCDSMLVYRGADIGTAKPTAEEMRGVPHHLIDILEPEEPFSAADYVERANRAEADILARGRLPVLCGGTGFYLDAFLRGGFPEASETRSDPTVRERLNAELARVGAHAMHEKLRAIDPDAAETIHENNVRRVLRALELYETTGKTKSELDSLTPQGRPVRDYVVIALRHSTAGARNAAIERRTEKMFAAGLADECRTLAANGFFDKCPTACKAIGYKELFPFLEGRESEKEAQNRLNIATRHYAKRQLTWFSGMEYVKWLVVDREGEPKDIRTLCDEAEKLCNFGV